MTWSDVLSATPWLLPLRVQVVLPLARRRPHGICRFRSAPRAARPSVGSESAAPTQTHHARPSAASVQPPGNYPSCGDLRDFIVSLLKPEGPEESGRSPAPRPWIL